MLLDAGQAAALRSDRPPTGATFFPISTWPNGVMPVEFDPGITTAERALFMATCATWTAETPFRCAPHTSEAQFAFVAKQTAADCSASVGRPGSGNGQVNLAAGCWTADIVLHELGHAIGLMHEHQRVDRDQYIWVDSSSPQVTARPTAYDAQTAVVGRGPYDFLSVMHYSDWAILPKPAYVQFFRHIGGGRDPDVPADLSAGDAAAVRSLYGAARPDDPPAITAVQVLSGGVTGVHLSLSPASAVVRQAVSASPTTLPTASVSVAPSGSGFDVYYTLLGTGPGLLTLTLAGPGGSYDLVLPVRAGVLPAPTTMPPPGRPDLRIQTQYDDAYGVGITPTYGSYPSQVTFEIGTASGRSDIGVFTGTRFDFGTLPLGIPSGTLLPRHYIRARVQNGYGEAWSDEVVTGLVDAATLSVDATANPVTLTWDHRSWIRASSFRVAVGTQAGATDIGTFDAGLALSLKGNAPVGLPLFARVFAVGRNGSVPSNEVRFVVAGPARPLAPVLAAASITGDTVSLSWTGNAMSYRVLARATPGGTAIADAPVAASSISFSGVPAGTYHVSVVGVTGAQVSAESNSVVVTVQAPAPPTAPVLQAARVIGSLVELDWQGPGGTYEVRARTIAGGPIVARLPVQSAHLSVPGVPSGVYFVSVVAMAGSTASAESNVVRVDVP